MKNKPYWIKERHNPQLGIYHVACGQMSKTEAKRHEYSLYGDNVMLRYDSKEDYDAAVKQFKAQ